MAEGLSKRKDNDESREYWAFVEEVSKEVATWPAWMRAGWPTIGYGEDGEPLEKEEKHEA